MHAYKTNLTPPHFNKVSAQREESEFFLRFFYWILELFRQCGIFVYHIFNIISHFNLLFFHTFQILSLFNFFSSIFFISLHNFLPYFPYLFTIQLTFLPYVPYLFFIVSNDSFKSEFSRTFSNKKFIFVTEHDVLWYFYHIMQLNIYNKP